MTIIYTLARQALGKIIIATICSIVSANAFTIMIALIHKGLEGRFSQEIVWGFVGSIVVYAILDIVGKRMFLAISLQVISKLREDLTRVLLRSSLRNIETLSTHRIQSVLLTELDFIAHSISDMAHAIIKVFQVLGVITYFAYSSPKVIIVALVFIPILFFLQYLPALKAAEYIHREREAQWWLHRKFEEAIFGVRELLQNYFKRMFFLDNELRPALQNYRRVALKNRTIDYMFSHWNDVLIFLCMGTLVFVFGRLEYISIAMTRDIVLFVLVLKDPAMSAVNLIGNIYRANLRMKTINELGFDLQNMHDSSIDAVTEADLQSFADFKVIQFKDVCMRYDATDPESCSVGPITLEIRRNEIIFLVGGNGSGKTTLIKLLSGLYTPESGEIRIDGELLTQEKYPAFREMFHTIFADFFLFPRLKLPSFDPGTLENFRKLLGDFELTGKTDIASDGELKTTSLSQGQRKRLTLASGIIEDRLIYILDEWAADQDPHFKRIYYHEILPGLKAKDKTLIVISHDDRYFESGDRLVTMEEGKIKSDRAL